MGVAHRRTRFLISFAALAGVVLLLGGFASSAHAIEGHFCPPYPGGWIALDAYGSPSNSDRCAGPFHSRFSWLSARNTLTPVMKCVVLKPNSNGSGGNVGGLAAGCAAEYGIAVQYPGGLGGYGTVINLSGNYHTGFEGRHDYY
jgi:hypothetical protein